MGIKYEKYKAVDFLSDAYFIETTFRPTSESEEFWKSLIYEEKVDHNEFISAYIVLKSLRTDKFEVPQQRLDNLWTRIEKTNLGNVKKRKNRPFRFPVYILTGSIAAAFFIILMFVFMKPTPKQQAAPVIAKVNYEKMNRPSKPSDKIELVAGDVVMEVDGVEANVEYNKNGGMQVNKESVAVAVKEEAQVYQLRVPYGKRAFLKLADGTSLWVNSGSTVIYPSAFEKDSREIFVEGEVYAEVVHDEKRPFTVTTNTMDVKVLGTVFNLSAYKDDKQTNLVLVSGAVRAKPKNGQIVDVKPNQLLSCNGNACMLKTVDVDSYTSWRNGVYIFSNESIGNILLRIARYYNIAIKLPASAPEITCSGKLVLKDELDQLLHGLSAIAPIKYTMTEKNECLVSFDNTPFQK